MQETRVEGQPVAAHVGAPCAERQNPTMRRFTRLASALGKGAENHAHMVALHAT